MMTVAVIASFVLSQRIRNDDTQQIPAIRVQRSHSGAGLTTVPSSRLRIAAAWTCVPPMLNRLPSSCA